MINIVVCDDSEYDIKKIRSEVEKYEKQKYVIFNIVTYRNPLLLLSELKDGKVADIYILDVSMPEKNGFDVASEIRSVSESAVIIFLTSMQDRAIDGYKMRALRYILKDNLSKEICEALDSAVTEVSKPNDKVLTVHRYGDYWRLYYGDIIYVSRVSRQLIIMTSSHGKISDTRGIAEFYDILSDDRFLFIDRSCFVNVDYILQIEGCEMKLKNGTVLNISRGKLHSVKQRLLELWGI